MEFIARIDIMPKKEILDPQGKAVKLGLGNLGLKDVEDVRIGKHITMHFQAESEEEAHQKVEAACEKLLANVIMENFSFDLESL